MTDESTDKFINPYTFVPLPPNPPKRERPNGHLGNPGLLSGTLRITISAKSPLLIRGFPANCTQGEQGDEEKRPSKLPRRPDGTPIIPGSALKGAVRSLHETLTASCLRVLNSDFVPVYRDHATRGATNGLIPAVVESHDNEHKPPVVTLCAPEDRQPHKVHQEDLQRLNDEEPLTAGTYLALHESKEHGPPDVARHTESDGDDNKWVLFLSEASARNPAHPYRAHIRKLSGPTMHVSEQAWTRYLALVEGADDGRTANVRTRDASENTEKVTFKYTPTKGKEKAKAGTYELGHRHVASTHLAPGQPVWVRLNHDETEVCHLQLSMLWRHMAEADTAGERAGDFRPCQGDDVDERDGHHVLCPSCQVFGSAQDSGDETAGPGGEGATDVAASPRGPARQLSYRGHVRFGDAHVDAPDALKEPETIKLPPMGKPNPGAGQFYLATHPKDEGNAGDPPLREWGSAADLDTARRLRGRKYYWHTPTETGERPRRAHAKSEQSQNMVAQAEVFPTGTTFTATLAFTDLSRAQLGGLLATLEPHQLTDVDGLHVHVGGGRPFGFGSCHIQVDDESSLVWESGARYGRSGECQPLAKWSGLVEAFRDSLPELQETWRLTAIALNPASIDEPDKVTYPPGAGWDQRGDEQFDKGFEFWQQTSGTELTPKDGPRRGYPLTSLPHIEADQKLPIVRKATSKPLHGQGPRKGKRP